MPEEPGREAPVELGAGIGAMPLQPVRTARLAQAGRLVLGVGRELAGQHIAQVAEQVHRLVIAEREVQSALRRRRLLLQPHQQVEYRPGVGAAVEQVAGHHEVGCTGRPAKLRVDDANRLEQSRQLRMGAVHVGHGNHALDAGPASGH